MKRSISVSGLLFSSISPIIGSGWLFACYYTANLAGPAAVISWLIGSVSVIIIAFVFAELCVMLPITGSSVRIPQFTHGSVVGFIFAWIIWLAYMSMTPTEVQAVIQYLAFYFPKLIHHAGALTHAGYVVATILMALISFINIYSLRWLMRCNSFLTVLKIIIPTFISIIIIFWCSGSYHAVHLSPFSSSTLMPYGLQGVFAAISSGGIVFAFNGFKQAAEMAGEAKNPRFALPFAIIGSVVGCTVIFLLLQVAFLISLQPHNLVSGWSDLVLARNNSPLASIIDQDNLDWLLPVLYVGAILAPLAAAMMYCSSAARSLYGMSKNGYVSKILQQITLQGNPIWAVVANFVVGMFMFAPLPGWDKMITFLSSLMAITYGIGPIALLALRVQLPNYPRAFRLPFGKAWAVLAFYLCNLYAYWSGWHIIIKFEIAVFIGVVVLFFYHLRAHDEETLGWKQSIWLWVYFVGLGMISYLGSFGGGLGVLPFGVDFVVVAIFSVFIAWLALKYRLPASRTEEYIKALRAETE